MKTATIEGYENYTICENGVIQNIKTGRIIRPWLCKTGYLRVNLPKKKKKQFHRLLMESFVPNPNNYPCINHIDGNKQNNSLDNLEWCTYAHNINHAIQTGLKTVSEKQRILLRENGYKSKGRGKLILNTQTGIYYNSIGELINSLSYKVGYKTISNMLSGYTKNITPFIYA